MINILLKISITVLAILFFYEIHMRFFRQNSASSPESLKIINTLDEISDDLIDNINHTKYYETIKKRTVRTVFTEMTHTNYNILATNLNKGETILVRLKDRNGNYFSAEKIIKSLLHELAHSATIKVGHFKKWEDINDYFYNEFGYKYVEYLRKKTVLK